jgi:serine/threonine protein kinase
VAPADKLTGEVVDGKYRIDALLGQGGMGTVHRATHLGTGRAVALKVLVPELTANEAAVERFKREARAAGQLRHLNVVDVTDFGFAERGGERFAYLVMELLRGRTLRALLDAEGPLALDTAVDVLDQVCAAVTEAHALGILHRDLKPENIHVEPGPRGGYHVKVLDFGIAKLLDEAPSSAAAPPSPGGAAHPPVDPDAATVAAVATDPAIALTVAAGVDSGDGGALTGFGTAIGTPRYMSPEQWLGRAVDARADVYSLGVCAYEMLTGNAPFVGASGSIAKEHAEAPPPSLAHAPGVPRGVAAAIDAALAKDPADRPASAAAFAAALRAGAETTGGLIRRAMGLCVDHYGLFFRRCAPATITCAAALALLVVSRILADRGVVSAGFDVAAAAATIAVAFVAHLFITPIGGHLVPVVVAVTAARPPPRPPPVAAFLRTATGALPGALVVFLLNNVANGLVAALSIFVAKSTGMYDLDQPAVRMVQTLVAAVCASAAMAPFLVVGPVVAVEGMRGLAPLGRSAALTRPLRRMAFIVELVPYVLAQTLAALVQPALVNLTGLQTLGGHRTSVLVHALVFVATMPFIVVASALLYVRARETRGEPLAADEPSGG